MLPIIVLITLIVQGKDFMLLYSLYSWPNVFLCFLGGYLIDKVFGIRY